jgi:predicted amidohydrolase
VLAEAGEDPTVIFADIDLAESAAARARIPALRHGRDIDVEVVRAGEARRTRVSGKSRAR